MSETKAAEPETSSNGSLGSEHKSSKDILNELFSSFNTSFDENAVDEGADSDGGSKKKKKKSKKSKKSSKGDGDSSGDERATKKDKSPPAKKKRKDKEKHAGDKPEHKSGSKRKSKETGDDEDAEDVNELIAKHRTKVKKKCKGAVSSYGDLIIKNVELLKSKKKRLEDLRDTLIAKKKEDVEDGEILDEDAGSPLNKLSKKEKHKKKQSKLSASQAYKLDLEENVFLDMDNNKHHESRSKSRSRSESKSKSHSDRPDRRKSDEHRQHESSSKRSHREEESHHNHKHIRQAPPRDPSPPPDSRGSPPPSSRRSYSYNDTGWQKERDRDYRYESASSSSSSRRRDRYEVDGYYDQEASRRSDGRTGFGFSRTYYDEPIDNSKDRSRSHHHHSESRGRSRSPRNRSRSSRRSRSRSPQRRWRRSRSRSRDRHRHPDDIIDKAKLLEIARKNAAKLMRRGVLPTDIFSKDQIIAIRAGGKSVEELTDYCHRLARKDARGDAMSDDSGGSDGEGTQFIHHPFHVKDRPLPQITMNIRNAIPIPLRTPQELAIEGAKLKQSFPVSSGTQHRIKELEWHPVDKEEEEKKAKAAEDANKSLVPLDGPKTAVTVVPVEQPTEGQTQETAVSSSDTEMEKSEAVEVSSTSEIKMDHPKAPDFDISDVIAIRLRAMRQLSENPQSDEAKQRLEDATQMMKRWADAKALEPKFLTQSELTQGPQAWAKRDQLTNAKEVQSPMGLHLLQKMGWKPGEGLGKNKAGDTEPLALEVKTDKKGLTSVLDYKKGPSMPLVFDLSAKHPISALMELCAKRKWGQPDFALVFEHGPPHKKQFVYKVTVNGVEYQPCVAVNNKKLAKANAAAFCLQSLGLLPSAKAPSPSDTLTTVQAPAPPPSPSVGIKPHAHQSGTNTIRANAVGGFTTAHYLQTVPGGSAPSSHPPPPAEVLMPPPPPPPPLKRFLDR